MKKFINREKKILCIFLMVLCINFVGIHYTNNNAIAAPAKTTKSANAIINVLPTDVVKNPAKYLNKNITFNADFISYSSLGLDYKPALKESDKYIGILIQRNDVIDHVIPLSEMKIFLKREEAEKHLDLEQGDKIKITGTVFSTALGDPWVDVKTFTGLSKKNKKDKK